MNYRHLTFYQTDWQINALKICLSDSNILQKRLFKAIINNKDCWLCKIVINDHKQILLVIFDLNSPILLFNSEGLLVGTFVTNQLFYINDVSFVINEIFTSTGLQIKMDSGIFIVYLGFFVLMLSTVLSYLSYSQIWFYKVSDLFQFLGSTNRAVFFFEENIFYINFTYNSLIYCSNKYHVFLRYSILK